MDAPVDLDEQVRRTRERGDRRDLVALLFARGTLALRDDREPDASADYREAAEILAAYDDVARAVPVGTARMVWAAWAARCRREGRLDEALAAAREAVALRHDLPADDLQPFAGFYVDLKDLTTDLEAAGRAEDRVEAARLAYVWSQALYAAAERYDPMTGITGWGLANALGDAGRGDEAIEVALEVLPVLRRCELGAIAVGLLGALGGWLLDAGRWDESVDAEREAIAIIRRRPHRLALSEIAQLRDLARNLAGGGRPGEAAAALDEALAVATAPGSGVVPLRPEQAAEVVGELQRQRASLDSTT